MDTGGQFDDKMQSISKNTIERIFVANKNSTAKEFTLKFKFDSF